MAFTYSSFKTYLATFLWKDNDVVLIDNLDNLIQMADNELNRTFDVSRRNVVVTIAPDSEDFSLPADFRQTLSLIGNVAPYRSMFEATTFEHIYELRSRTNSAQVRPFYFVDSSTTPLTLRLVGPFSAQNPGDLTLRYRTKIPDFAATDASYMAEEYLDLYVYTILKHAAVFTREDERIPVWVQGSALALASAMDEDVRHIEFGGQPLHQQPTRQPPRQRRRR